MSSTSTPKLPYEIIRKIVLDSFPSPSRHRVQADFHKHATNLALVNSTLYDIVTPSLVEDIHLSLEEGHTDSVYNLIIRLESVELSNWRPLDLSKTKYLTLHLGDVQHEWDITVFEELEEQLFGDYGLGKSVEELWLSNFYEWLECSILDYVPSQ